MGGYLSQGDKDVTLGGGAFGHWGWQGGRAQDGPDHTNHVFNLIHGLLCKNVSFFSNSSPTERGKPGKAVFTPDLTARGLEFCERRGRVGWVEAPLPVCDPLESPGWGFFLLPGLHYLQSLGSPGNIVPEPPAVGPQLGLWGHPCRPAQPTWALGSLLVWGEPPTLCEPAGLGSVLQVAQALLTRALRRAGPQLLLKARLAFAGTKTTGSRHGRNTSTTSPRTSGPSWLPGWPSSSSSRCEGLLDFWKGWGLRRQGCSEKGQEGRNWPGSGVWRLGDSPWSPRGVRCW